MKNTKGPVYAHQVGPTRYQEIRPLIIMGVIGAVGVMVAYLVDQRRTQYLSEVSEWNRGKAQSGY